MSGLAQLSAYCSSSDSDSDNIETQPIRLPLPALFRQSIDERASEHVDKPEEHGGRIRSFPHKRGNWASYVYLPYYQDDEFITLVNKLKLECSHLSEFDHCDNYHISLSRTVVLKYHWISTFTSSLKDISKNINSFYIYFDQFGVYCNEEKTRTFLGLRVGDVSRKILMSIVTNIDGLLNEFRLESFYKDPSFHMSILWCVGDQRDKLKASIPTLNTILQEHLFDLHDSYDNCGLCIDAKELCFKTGNKLYNFALEE